MLRVLAALWLLLLAPWATAADVVPLPALSARVTDLTGTLTAAQQAALENASATIERDKGAQVVVLMLPTTQPETIEQFGIRLAEAWKIGRGGVDDGVIVIVAKDDRRMRIEVGYGLEGAIPDAIAKRIVAEEMGPRFKQGDFAGGLEAAVAALARLIGGEALPPPASPGGGEDSAEQGFLLFLVILFGGFLRALMGMAGSVLAAVLAGALAWGLFASWFAVAIAASMAFLFSFMRPGGGLGGGGFSSGGRGRGGGWSGGGGWSSGGGGFSGGGGGFGGGGASGSW